MDSTLAFALSLLQLSLCTPVPVTQDVANVVKMKTKVKWMAEQLVVRLDRDFQVTRHVFYEPPLILDEVSVLGPPTFALISTAAPLWHDSRPPG